MQNYKPPIEAPLSVVVKTIYKSEYSHTCFPCGKVQTCQSLVSNVQICCWIHSFSFPMQKKKNSYYLKNKTIICHLNCSNDHTSITIKLSPTTSNIQTSLISNLSQWKEKEKNSTTHMYFSAIPNFATLLYICLFVRQNNGFLQLGNKIWCSWSWLHQRRILCFVNSQLDEP